MSIVIAESDFQIVIGAIIGAIKSPSLIINVVMDISTLTSVIRNIKLCIVIGTLVR